MRKKKPAFIDFEDLIKKYPNETWLKSHEPYGIPYSINVDPAKGHGVSEVHVSEVGHWPADEPIDPLGQDFSFPVQPLWAGEIAKYTQDSILQAIVDSQATAAKKGAEVSGIGKAAAESAALLDALLIGKNQSSNFNGTSTSKAKPLKLTPITIEKMTEAFKDAWTAAVPSKKKDIDWSGLKPEGQNQFSSGHGIGQNQFLKDGLTEKWWKSVEDKFLHGAAPAIAAKPPDPPKKAEVQLAPIGGRRKITFA